MSITDELRDYVYGRKGLGISPLMCGTFAAIADRIDAAHERVRAESIIDMTDGAMAEHGWIRLPKDADGEYIHIGDVMDGVDKYDSLKEVTGKVTTISFDSTSDPDDSRSVGIRVWSDDRRSYHIAYLDPRASVYHHHKQPTVEDVLREFAGTLASAENNWGSDVNDAIAEYAKRLKLAGEGE